MLAKLLALLLHAKAGAISGVFLLGATGALVSVSTSNGVTTIVLTEPSPTPTATATVRPSATTSPTATPSPTPSPQLSSAPALLVPTACTDEATAIAFQVQRVDSAFTGFHTDLMKLRAERDRATVEKADRTLKLVRQAAVKAIHATATASCKKHDEDENDNDDETDNDDNTGEHEDKGAAQPAVTTVSFDLETTNVEDNDGKDKTNLGITFTGDAASIATQAIAAMQTAFDTAKNAPAVTPKPEKTKRPDSTHGPKASPEKGKGEHHD